MRLVCVLTNVVSTALIVLQRSCDVDGCVFFLPVFDAVARNISACAVALNLSQQLQLRLKTSPFSVIFVNELLPPVDSSPIPLPAERRGKAIGD
jgi:hypothetical protein